MNKFIAAFFIVGLVYLLWPGPGNVTEFSQLPNALKSDEPGDTLENPQRAAFFSDNFRDSVMSFYISDYQRLNYLPFGPIRINYPPEYAYTAVKDQILSTYLEELVYPMKSSLFINGFEPFYEDGTPKYKGATTIEIKGTVFATKTTLRFYPSSILVKIIVWIGVTAGLYWLIKLGRRILDGKLD